MTNERLVRALFGRFRDLNLLMLRESLRHGTVTVGDWSWSDRLCPIAHGLHDGAGVEHVKTVGRVWNLRRSCACAAEELGADAEDVWSFVAWWDACGREDWLLDHLDCLWQERLEDADAVQAVLGPRPESREWPPSAPIALQRAGR